MTSTPEPMCGNQFQFGKDPSTYVVPTCPSTCALRPFCDNAQQNLKITPDQARAGLKSPPGGLRGRLAIRRFSEYVGDAFSRRFGIPFPGVYASLNRACEHTKPTP